jgi:hypothetical protein
MAGFFQQVLKGAVEGFFNDAYLRDFKHASKTFTTNGFENAPKFKWLFHVYFEFNPLFAGLYGQGNHGLLVKSISLPKFGVSVTEMNQYNRKRYIQTKHTYDPVSITFHDDNAGLIKKMWYDYYSYYYGDVTSAAANQDKRNTSNIYASDISGDQTWGYIAEPANTPACAREPQSKVPFFKSIKIFGFNQHNFSAYTLNSPTIERFDHDTYDYYQTTSTMENRMTIRYESVGYEEGALNGQRPGELVLGFGDEAVYDRMLSPISQPGGNKSILGQGGLLDGGIGILDSLSERPPNLLGAAAGALNIGRTWKNPREIVNATKGALITGALAAASNPSLTKAPFNFVSAQADKLSASLPKIPTPPTPPNP